VPFWPLDSGSEIRDRKKVSIRIRDLEYFLEFRNHFFVVKNPSCGSGIRDGDSSDPGSWMGKNQDPGSGINIPDPQHCINLK